MASDGVNVTIWFILVNANDRPICNKALPVDFPRDGFVARLQSKIEEVLRQKKCRLFPEIGVHGVWQCTNQSTTFTSCDMQVLETEVKKCFQDKKVRELHPQTKVQDLELLENETLLVRATVTRDVWYLVINNDMRLISMKISGVVAHTISELIRGAEVGQRQSRAVVWRYMLKKLSNKATLDDLREMIHGIDLNDRAQAIPLADSMLVTDIDVDEVLLVQVPGPDKEGEREHGALHLPLPSDENINFDYERVYTRIGSVIAPSANSRSTGHCKNQAIEHDIIYDGLCAPGDGAPNTSAPPIHMYHPVFRQFTRDANDPSIVPDSDFLENVWNFMGASCQGGDDEDDESNSGQKLRRLEELLEWTDLVEIDDDDGAMMFNYSQAQIPVAVVALKRSLGEGGCDPTIWVGNSMRKRLGKVKSKSIFDQCCCPVFMLTGGGPWLCVLGGVFINGILVQRLTDMMWIGLATTHEDHRVYRTAKVLLALKKSFQDLRRFYGSVVTTITIPNFDPHCDPHPRHFPYPHSFVDRDGASVVFEYLRRFEEDMTCVTYLAKIKSTGTKVVVKFVDRYSAEVHQFLAEQGHAPKLHYYGPLPDRTIYDSSEPAPTGQKQMNAGYRRLGPAAPPEMKMVVMEHIAQWRPRLDDVQLSHDKISVVLEKLHASGYVFGDLWEPNVMFDANEKVKLIDFDWTGPYDIKYLPTEQQAGIRKTWARLGAGYTVKPTAEERVEVEEALKVLVPRADDASDSFSRYAELTMDERIKLKKAWNTLDDFADTPFATYPIGLSSAIRRVDGVVSRAPILPSHDTAMLAKMHERWLNSQKSERQ